MIDRQHNLAGVILLGMRPMKRHRKADKARADGTLRKSELATPDFFKTDS